MLKIAAYWKMNPADRHKVLITYQDMLAVEDKEEAMLDDEDYDEDACDEDCPHCGPSEEEMPHNLATGSRLSI